MVDTYLSIIVPATIGAIVATVLNFIYYRYTTHKENKTKFLERQITELLLPLYFHLKGIESFFTLEQNTQDYYDGLRQDTKIVEIATAKLFLASPDLLSILKDFIAGQDKYYYEYQCGVFKGDFIESLPDGFSYNFDKLKDIVYTECEAKIKEYQKNYFEGFWDFLKFRHYNSTIKV